jgi:dTDP-4-dehydrorhamnose reductase
VKLILLLGATGQVGWELQRALSPLAPLVLPERGKLDIANAGSIRNGIAAVQPRLIVNAAAYTAVDRAEQEPEAAALVNAEAPAVMAESAKAHGIPLVHYSTDYVFAGDKAAPYSRPTNPHRYRVTGARSSRVSAPFMKVRARA